MTNSKPRATSISVIAVLMLMLATDLLAKTTAATLPELVQESSVIVYGHIDTVGSPPPRASWVSFKVSEVIKGNPSLTAEAIFLCNSPPPMREYPDLSKLTGNLVLFLSSQKGGCFDFSHTVKSVVEVHGDQATTVVIDDQPDTQSFKLFLEKLRNLVAK
jgi:hypothetical protein